MTPHAGRAQRSFHLFVVAADRWQPEPSDLLGALGDRVETVTVAAWSRDPDSLSTELVCHVADVLDHVEATTGTRPGYEEWAGSLPAAVADRLAHEPDGRTIVVVSSSVPRRLQWSIRRVMAAHHAHLGFTPPPAATAGGVAR